MWYRGYKDYRRFPYAKQPADLINHEDVEGCHRSNNIPLPKRRAHLQAWEKIGVPCEYCGLSNVPSVLSKDEAEWLTPPASWNGKSVKQWFAYEAGRGMLA